MKIIKKLLILFMCVCLTFTSSVSYAHSGRTDSSGGHHDYKNKSGLGSYHYHHGMGPHLHQNGVCPYSSKTSSSSSTKNSSSSTKKNSKKKSKYYTTSNVKKVQKKLNKLGYDCGEADGKYGSKTKSAIKEFQNEKNMTVNGKINKSLMKKLKIS